MTDDRIEAAAKALFAIESRRWIGVAGELKWDQMGAATKDAFRDAARQIIESYLEVASLLDGAHLAEPRSRSAA